MRIFMFIGGLIIGQPIVDLSHWCVRNKCEWLFHTVMTMLLVSFITFMLILYVCTAT